MSRLDQMRWHAERRSVLPEHDLMLWAHGEIERLRAVLKLVDDDVRHHLRSDEITHALIRKRAVKAVREILNQ
jgi:hypothetical protein